MRIVIDIMIGLMLIAVVAGGLYLYNSKAHDEQQTEVVRAALQQLQEQAAYHTTVQSAMAGQDVLLVHLHREWFGEDVPTNVLVEGDRPWIDLAPPGDLGDHPPDPVVSSQTQAGFWYNPTTGTFRARVTPAASEALTLALYNEINGTALPGFDPIPDTTRQPMAHTLGLTPARQYASMANKTWSEKRVDDDLPATDLITVEHFDTSKKVSDTAETAEKPLRINQVNDLISKEQQE
ncbi:MAG: hypothetical protein AB8C95_13405 [Phycisphaeraceae bacterium]